MAPPAPAPSPAKPKKNSYPIQILGRYELVKLLGQGSFAKVFLAKNLKNDQSVAIKVLDKERICEIGLVAHTKREIAILRRVRHPNIVHLLEVMATRSKIFFVMEYVRGGELFGKVAKGRLEEDAARRYFQQLISAVGFCHARGVFHRDLKPENLLLDEKGDLKVLDFGLSAVSEQIQQDGLFHTFCGTPAYVAPEVLSRKGYDGAKVDIWSCGIILFVLMAGYLPFHDQNVMVMYRKIYKGEFRCPKWFSSDLCNLIVRLLDTNSKTRITIPEIMEDSWFKKGFRHIRFYVEDGEVFSLDEIDSNSSSANVEGTPLLQHSDETSDSGCDSDCSVNSCPATMVLGNKNKVGGIRRPLSLNAFDIICFSQGFNLSGLFEESGDEARFVSGEPVSVIISKLEEIAKLVRFTVRKKDFFVSLEGTREGEKGPLTIGAEIFELTPSLVVVEVKKKAGDRMEYEKFYNMDLKPGLQSLMYVTSAPNNVATKTE